MKNSFKHIAAIVLVAATVLAIAFPINAQVTPTTVAAVTGLPTDLTASSTSNVLTAIEVHQGKSFAVAPYFATTNSSTANLTLVWDLSLDGTNYCTLGTISQTYALNGTTGVRGYTIVAPTSIGPARYIRLKTAANAHTATLFLTNIMYGWSP